MDFGFIRLDLFQCNLVVKNSPPGEVRVYIVFYFRLQTIVFERSLLLIIPILIQRKTNQLWRLRGHIYK